MFRKTLLAAKPLTQTLTRPISSSNAYFKALFSEGSVAYNKKCAEESLANATSLVNEFETKLIEAKKQQDDAKKVFNLFSHTSHEMADRITSANRFKELFLKSLYHAAIEKRTHFGFEFHGNNCTELFSQLQPFLTKCGFTISGGSFMNIGNQYINRYHANLMSAEELDKQTHEKTNEAQDPTPLFLKTFITEINDKLAEAKDHNETHTARHRSLTGC